MKHLATMGIIQETGPDEYRPTNLSRTLAVPKYADGFPCMCVYRLSRFPNRYEGDKLTSQQWQLRHRRHLQAPEYLSKTGYKNSTNPVDGPFQCAFNKSQHWFAWAHDDQPVLMQFNNHMGAYREGRPSWMDPDFYPVQELLVKGARTDEDAVLLVDVGGSLGHDIEEFHRKHPTAPGRLVLQDLPAVIGQIERIDPAIEPTAYDFFTESLSKVCRCLHPDHTAHINPLSTRCSTMCSNHSNLMARRSIRLPHRCPCLLPPLHPPRLAGRCVPADPGASHRRHETGLQQAARQRERDPRH